MMAHGKIVITWKEEGCNNLDPTKKKKKLMVFEMNIYHEFP